MTGNATTARAMIRPGGPLPATRAGATGILRGWGARYNDRPPREEQSRDPLAVVEPETTPLTAAEPQRRSAGRRAQSRSGLPAAAP